MSVYIPPSLIEAIDLRARHDGLNRSALLCAAASRYLHTEWRLADLEILGKRQIHAALTNTALLIQVLHLLGLEAEDIQRRLDHAKQEASRDYQELASPT